MIKYVVPFMLSVFLGGCTTRPMALPSPDVEASERALYSQSIIKDVDLLFVIDNSNSMLVNQQNLRANFSKMIDALRSDKLDGALPNVRIGIVSTDVGIGANVIASCPLGGDQGKLIRDSHGNSCALPSDPWISYSQEKGLPAQTNIKDCQGDAIECVKQGFSCMADLGVGGCGIESPLEAARRALLPDVNPGFRRESALLAVIFITDEDDCSIARPAAFTQGFDALDGHQKNFRCFSQGIVCDEDTSINDQAIVGEKSNCKPAGDILYAVDAYIDFFKGLKEQKEHLIVAGLTAPSTPVNVVADPDVAPSCSEYDATTDTTRFGRPALRLNHVIESVGGSTFSICSNNFGPALEKIAQKILPELGAQCIRNPLLLEDGSVACAEGVEGCNMPTCAADESCDLERGRCVKADGTEGDFCGPSCLSEVDCTVQEVIGETKKDLQRCPVDLFNDASLDATQCGDHCPCWRIVPRGKSCTDYGLSPFGFEVMRREDPPMGALLETHCRTSLFQWSEAEVVTQGAHCRPPLNE